MKLNKELFKRESTWLNIAECVGGVVAQLFVSMPSELSGPLWGYIIMRVLMGFVQGVKASAE